MTECWSWQNRYEYGYCNCRLRSRGLYCALNLPKDKNIIIVTKEEASKSDSFLAQGGVCVLRDETDYDSFYEDTMKAGHYENNPDSVDIMIRSSREVINELVGYGVHGRNRLASNSLLESLVFAKRAAGDIKENYRSVCPPEIRINPSDYDGKDNHIGAAGGVKQAVRMA